MVTLTQKKINVFADRVFTPQKKSKKTRFQKPLFFKKWTILYNYLLLLLYYIQTTKCSYLWLLFSCECFFTRCFCRVYTKQPFTRATYRTATLPTIDLTQQTAPPHHYPSQLLSLSSLSDWATELLKHFALWLLSHYQNG